MWGSISPGNVMTPLWEELAAQTADAAAAVKMGENAQVRPDGKLQLSAAQLWSELKNRQGGGSQGRSSPELKFKKEMVALKVRWDVNIFLQKLFWK